MRKLKPVINQSFQSIISLKSNQSTAPATVQSLGRMDSDYGLISRHPTAVEPTTRRSGVQVIMDEPVSGVVGCWWVALRGRGLRGCASLSRVRVPPSRVLCCVTRQTLVIVFPPHVSWVLSYLLIFTWEKRTRIFSRVEIKIDKLNLRYLVVLLLVLRYLLISS